jgi:hypothetical protein
MTEPPEAQQQPAPEPLKPKDDVEPSETILFCREQRRWMWSDLHAPCECHLRRFLHRH